MYKNDTIPLDICRKSDILSHPVRADGLVSTHTHTHTHTYIYIALFGLDKKKTFNSEHLNFPGKEINVTDITGQYFL